VPPSVTSTPLFQPTSPPRRIAVPVCRSKGEDPLLAVRILKVAEVIVASFSNEVWWIAAAVNVMVWNPQ